MVEAVSSSQRQSWALFISGRGSNLVRALDVLGEDVRVVVTSDMKAEGVFRARRRGIRVIALPVLESSGETISSTTAVKVKIDWALLDRRLRELQVDRIFLLGFMRIVDSHFLEKWSDRCFNLHPSLLPLYPGLKSIERAIRDRSRMGASVHGVVPQVDAGPILDQVLTADFERESFEGFDSTLLTRYVHVDEQRLVERSLGKINQTIRQNTNKSESREQRRLRA